MTGLDRKSKNNKRLMNKIAEHTRLEPKTRYKHIEELVNKITKSSKGN